MPAPVGEEPEWIELYNCSNQDIILKNCYLSNINKTYPLPEMTLKPDSYAVITADTIGLLIRKKISVSAVLVQSSIPILHNTFDPVVLRNEDLSVIDSVFYDMKWGKSGVSFERVDCLIPALTPVSLKTSLSSDSATPGYKNSAAGGSQVSYQAGSVKINEIMYEVDKDNAEFVELWNSTGDFINLNGWAIHDRPGKTTQKIIQLNTKGFFIPPNEYAVIVWDSVFFNNFPELKGTQNVFFSSTTLSLNNDGDDIVLLDATVTVQDSLSYLPEWHVKSIKYTKNISLEKIRPNLVSSAASSWSTCGDIRGGTPGRVNSLMQKVKENIVLTANPNPFSPIGSNESPNCKINFQLPYNQAWVSCKIYDTGGTLVRELTSNLYTSSSGFFEWDGKNERNEILPIGQYVLILAATDAKSDNSTDGKIVLVIGN